MFYKKEISEIIEEFNSTSQGLVSSQILENRKEFGENKLEEKKKKSVFSIFLSQFKDLLVIILIIAAIISMATGNTESTIVILAVLILNAILGTVQYVKAEKSLESLKNMSAPMAKVIRAGKSLEIPASELVCGDIIRLDAGDIVPGDGRIIESHSLKLNESSLTGESEAVEKTSNKMDAPSLALGDQVNMVFSGSLVTYGRGTAIITAVGTNSQLGQIAALMSNTKERKTPLQVTMDNFSKKLSMGIIIICAVIFALNIYRGMDMADSLLFAVALAVAAIPEALSSIITISLAIGTSRMAKENAIIKDLNAVEGLGCVSIICSDKTGTLTQNKMTVEKIIPFKDEEALILSSILCNDTVVSGRVTAGDPTETALVDYYLDNRDDYPSIMEEFPRLSELPFDSDRKLMSTLHNVHDNIVMFTKGALDVVLNKASNLSREDKRDIKDKNMALASEGLRVLAFARKTIREKRQLVMEDEDNLEFLGLIAMMDPPRAESAKAVEDCKNAGIDVVMITGDHKVTASAIAKKIGIMGEDDFALTGLELDALSDDELLSKLEHIKVYARVSPDNKIRIVSAWQSKGHIACMTGDGVNDAPALKSADVGVAMGITGTEVAKDAASMILTDDNFATIIKSVVNGRNIYANIKNAIKFLLSGNSAAILTVLYASLLALPTPFTAVQLLFINLITDSLPALAISMEPVNHDLVREKPRSPSDSVLNKGTVTQIGVQGLIIGIATIIAFRLGLPYGAGTASTMAFATLCLGRLWHGFNSRGDASIFKLGLFTNLYTIGAFLLGAALLFGILLIPGAASAFSIATLSLQQLFTIIGLSFAPTFIIQCIKVFFRKAKES